MGCSQSCGKSDACEPEKTRNTEKQSNASRAQNLIQSQVGDGDMTAASATSGNGTEKEGTARTRAHSTTRHGTTGTSGHHMTNGDSPSKSALKTRPTVSMVPRVSEQEIVTCENDQLRQMGVVGRDKKTGNLKWNKAAMGTEHARDHCLSSWGRVNTTNSSPRHVPYTIGTTSGQRQTQEKNLVCFSDDNTIGNTRALHPKRDDSDRNSRSQSFAKTPKKRAKTDHRFASPLDSLDLPRCVKFPNRKTTKPKFLLEVAFDTPPESPHASDDERERDDEQDPRFGAMSSAKPLLRRQVSLGSKPQVMVLGSKAPQLGGDSRARLVKQSSDSRVSMEYTLTARREVESTESPRRVSNDDLENRRFPDGPFSLSGARFSRQRSHSASMSRERKEGETPKQQGRWSQVRLRQPNKKDMRESRRERAIRRASIDSGDSPANLLEIQIRDGSVVLGGRSQRRHSEYNVETSPKHRMQSVWACPPESQANTPDSKRGSRTEECESAYNHSREMCVCYQYRQDQTDTDDSSMECHASSIQGSFGQSMGTHPLMTLRHNDSNGSVYVNVQP